MDSKTSRFICALMLVNTALAATCFSGSPFPMLMGKGTYDEGIMTVYTLSTNWCDYSLVFGGSISYSG